MVEGLGIAGLGHLSVTEMFLSKGLVIMDSMANLVYRKINREAHFPLNIIFGFQELYTWSIGTWCTSHQ